MLTTELKSVTDADFEAELRDYLDPLQLAGLDKKVAIALNGMIEAILKETGVK